MDSSGRFSMLRNVIVVSQLPDLKGNIVSPDYLQQWPHLKDIELQDMREMKVGLLIGQDNPQALIPMEVRSGSASEPYATRTVYGWAINGPVRYLKNSPITANMVCVNKDLETAVEKFWDLERIDTTDGKLHMSREDKRVLDLWNASIETEDGRYKLPIPFKEQDPILPNNYPVADSRLSSLGRKLLGSEEMRQKYAAGIHDLVMKGYAEKVPEDQLDCPEGPVWYIPHHVVLNENKPDKFRIVFDCSAKFQNVSLNSKVLQGPDLTNSLIGVLLRFRENRIAISSDIESMFLQVRISDQHTDAVRFLWFKDDDPTQVPQVYRMKSHLFGGVWSSSVANYAVRRAAEDYGQQYDNLTVETVLENFYVDDCLKSVPSEQTAIKLIASVCELLQKGGFRLTKWISNSRSVLQTVPVSERGKELKNVDLCSDVLPQDKALGVKWDTETDNLVFKYKLKDKPPTKRGLISVISSVYDPLGFLCPLVLTAKIIFQNETRLRKDWDAPIADVNLKKWKAWITKLSQIEHFSIPRCIIPNGCEEAELHHFADASADGYGAVAYLRLKNSNGEVSCAFLFAKSRLAPIKSVTIPRLELSAAVLSVEMDKLLRTELRVDLSTSTFWTDSCIVLHYIKNQSHRYQTFVANRVAKICEASSPSQWRHVESSLNPADFASRELDADEFVAKHTWINGPDFLRNSEDEWPTNLVPDDVPAENLEIRKPKVNMVDAELDESCIDRLMKRHSSLYGLKKAVSWLLRLKKCLLRRVREKNSHITISLDNITVEEMLESETVIVKHVQKASFLDEVKSLNNGKAVKKSSQIYSLEPIMSSDGILRIGGRLKNHPVILPKSHHVVLLIIRQYHESLGHSGPEHCLSAVREKFWIIKGRSAIKRALSKCVKCKRLQGSNLQQKMADLPDDRITPGKPPFTHVGIDCFGPFLTKRGRSQVKRYGCVFTCLETRSVHIEMLNSLNTSSFIEALRRFEARRGVPELIRSDNGSNFRGAEKELKLAIQGWNQGQIKDYMLQRNIKWIFNPPTASNFGGVWERQIRTIRKVLNALLGQQHLDDENLSTFFCEVEKIINSRPITVVPDSPKDLEPLTPNHLLLMRSGHPMPPGKFSIQDTYNRRWKHVQFLADQFWRRWVREYLPALQLRPKWLKSCVNLCEGDIVLLMCENSPRCIWPLARITKVFHGKDGLVRSVSVKTKDSEFIRPVNKLCLLESVEHNN